MQQINAIEKRLTGLSSLIGNTPLFEIKLLYKGDERRIYAKAEYKNMTGSKQNLHVYSRKVWVYFSIMALL